MRLLDEGCAAHAVAPFRGHEYYVRYVEKDS